MEEGSKNGKGRGNKEDIQELFNKIMAKIGRMEEDFIKMEIIIRLADLPLFLVFILLQEDIHLLNP